MNECLRTPQHKEQIGYWVSEKGKCMKWLNGCVGDTDVDVIAVNPIAAGAQYTQLFAINHFSCKEGRKCFI